MKKQLIRGYSLSIILTLVSLYSVSIFAQDNAINVPLFESSDELEITLTYDIKEFRKHREDYQEDGVQGTVTLSDGTQIPVEIISRGQGSLDNTNPPFKLKFKKENSANTVFSGIKKIKAFPNPDEDSVSGELNVKSNYLNYKLMEMFGEYAFKTRMLKIKYVDTSGKIDSFTSHSFLLEPNKLVAKRYNAEYVPFKPIDYDAGETEPSCDVTQVTGNIDDSLVEQMTAFQFLIGNFDYAIPGYESNFFKGTASSEKNIKMIKDDEGKFYPLAYDFDFSGMIDRGICWWELGNGVFNPSRSEHFSKVGVKCDKETVKKHFREDLKDYYYKDQVKAQFKHFVDTVKLWKEKYQEEINEFTPDYISNLDIWISAVDEVLNE